MYNEEHIDLILWYIALFRLYDLFRLLIERSNSSTLNLDDFQSDSLIDNYAEDAKNYYEALNKCLENKLEELAKLYHLKIDKLSLFSFNFLMKAF